MHRGNILLHRKIVEWEWYNDANTMRLFIHLLLTANWQDKSWKGISVKRGQRVVSIDHLAKELELSAKQIRVALVKLNRTNEVASKGASSYTLITLLNYDSYQDSEKIRASKKASKEADEGQAEGKQRATTKSLKSLEPINNKDIVEIPESLNQESFFTAWSEWKQHLIEKKIKTTPSAFKKQLSKLEAFGLDKALFTLDYAIEHNWQGIFEPKGYVEKKSADDLFDDGPSAEQIEALEELGRKEHENHGGKTLSIF